MPKVFRDLLENANQLTWLSQHLRVARFKGYSPTINRLGVPNAEGAQKREILSELFSLISD